jgi:broad specificity phosphatase PhoE
MTAAFGISVNLVACGDSDSVSNVQPDNPESVSNVQSCDSDSALDWLSNGSAEVAISSESSNIESSSSDLELSCSGCWFGGSLAQDSPEGTSLGLESASLPVSSATEISSSSATEQSSSSERSSSSAKAHSITLDQDGFATVADVYNSLLPEEKAVFIIRHSEREDAVTMETELTSNGVKMAQDLGKTLKSDEEFSYITSGFVRTNETANNISKGRGESTLPKLITNYDITGNWFLKISADSLARHADALGLKGSSVELMARWAYEGGYPEVFYGLESRAEEFIQTVVLKNLPKWKRVSIMVSHDIFVMPLAVFGSQQKVALKYHEDYHWINYIAGLAVIVGTDNSMRYIPVKGTDSGIIDYLAIYMKRSP